MSDFFTRNTLVLEDEEKGFKVEGLDKSTIQSLSITGAFDEIRGEVSQKSIFEEATKVADFYKKSLIDSENRKRDDQLDLFKAMGDNFFDEESIQYNFPKNVVDYNWKEVMSNELDKMRLSYAVKPEDHISKIANKVAFRSDFEQLPFVHTPSQKNPHLYEVKEDVTCYGMVRAKRKIRNNTICFITFRDHTGIIETTFFMEAYKKYKFFLEENENAVLVFKGKLQRTTYGKTGHESNIYNMNVNDVWTLDQAIQDPTLLNDVNVRKIEQQSARSIQQPKSSAPALTSLNEQYNVAHIKVSNDLELKKALRQFFVEKDSPSKDTKVVIHNYLQPNVKTDVVVVNNFTLSLEDIKGLISNGTLNKRDVIITPKQLA